MIIVVFDSIYCLLFIVFLNRPRYHFYLNLLLIQIWHHEQQAQTPYALNDCSAQYTNDGVFFLSVPDHYVYVCYPDGSSFFHYPQNNVWIPVHPS